MNIQNRNSVVIANEGKFQIISRTICAVLYVSIFLVRVYSFQFQIAPRHDDVTCSTDILAGIVCKSEQNYTFCPSSQLLN